MQGEKKNKGPELKAPSIGCYLPLLLAWSCKAWSSLGTSVHALAHARLHPGSPTLTRFPGVLDCLVQVFISKASILVFPLVQVLLHGAQGIFHSRSCFIGLSSCCFGILDRLFCVLWKERIKISGMARSEEEAPLDHSLDTRKGAERTSLATPGQTLVPAQHVLHRLELAQELLLLHTEVSQLVLCCLQSAFNSCN